MALREQKDPAGGQYRFSLRKRYSYEMRYRKVEQPLPQKIKARILEVFGRKAPLAQPAPAAKPGEIAEEAEKKALPPSLSPVLAIRVGGLIGLVLLLFLAAFFYAQTINIPEEKWSTEMSAASVSANIEDSDIITASDASNFRYPYHTAYSRVNITSTGLPNVTIGSALYDSIVPNSVFVLRGNRYQAESYPEFLSSLSAELSRSGMEANEISASELDKLTAGSMLVVPSGYIPEELASGTRPMLYSLMERGITIFYIGQDFSRMVSKSGSVVPTPASFTGYRDRINFDTRASLVPDSAVSIKNPLYAATGLESSKIFNGAYSALSYKGGYIIFAPQTLDGGWESGSDAGRDVAGIMLGSRWLTPKATAGATVPLSGNDLVELFTSSFEGDSGYMKVYGYNREGEAGFYKVYYLKKRTNGEIYMRGHSILPSSIAPTQMDMIILLRETGGEKFLFLSITNITGEVEGGRTSIAGTKVSLNSQLPIPYTFSLPTGDYVLNIVDQEGNTYARSYLRVKDVRVVPVFSNMRTDTYAFRMLGDGEAIAPDAVTVKIDGGSYGTYTFRETGSFQVDLRAAGYSLPEGMHYATFESGTYKTTVQIDKRAPPAFYTQPFFLGAIAIALVALAIAYIFKASETPMYGLDIPDFPPQSTTKVPLKKEVLLGLFEKVNQKYRWKHTPLKPAEVKGAFKDLLYEGKPIFISDYNLEYLLDQLVGLGLLRKEAGYYSLSSWEEESGRSAKCLAMFRALRDICINEAVPFTPMGTGREYDTRLTVLGQDIYVHLYEGPASLGKVMGSLHLGLNLILAEDEGEVEEINEYLSSGDKAATLLKLEVQSGSVQVKTLDDLQKMIKDMKV